MDSTLRLVDTSCSDSEGNDSTCSESSEDEPSLVDYVRRLMIPDPCPRNLHISLRNSDRGFKRRLSKLRYANRPGRK